MKNYTDLEQSKTLAKFLSLESADMIYMPIMDIDSMSNSGFFDIPECYPFNEFKNSNAKPLPCWSLAALLSVIPVKLNGYKDMVIRLRMDKGDAGSDEYNLWYEDISTGVATSLDVEADNFVDACYEMVTKLHEQKLL